MNNRYYANSRYYTVLPDRTLAPRPVKKCTASYNYYRSSVGGQAARQIRLSLKPVRTQSEIAEILGVTKAAVEQIELRALAKLYWAFAAERRAHKEGLL